MPVVDHVPQAVQLAAQAVLDGAAGLSLELAHYRVQASVPDHAVELIESPSGARRLHWPRRSRSELFSRPPESIETADEPGLPFPR